MSRTMMSKSSSFWSIKEQGDSTDDSLPVFAVIWHIKCAEKFFSINWMVDRDILNKFRIKWGSNTYNCSLMIRLRVIFLDPSNITRRQINEFWAITRIISNFIQPNSIKVATLQPETIQLDSSLKIYFTLFETRNQFHFVDSMFQPK